MNGQLVFQNDFFKVEHCDDCYISGHLIVRPLQAVNALADLPLLALQSLGPTLALCHAAIRVVIKPSRIYTLSFCELLPLLHFHIFPRTATLLQTYNSAHTLDADTANGALFFDWARKQSQTPEADYEMVQHQIEQAFLDLQRGF